MKEILQTVKNTSEERHAIAGLQNDVNNLTSVELQCPLIDI